MRDLLGRMIRWRIGWRWGLVAVSPLPALLVMLTGAGVPEPAEFARFSGLPAGCGVLGIAVAIVLLNELGEETGWRGYLQPALHQRFGPVAATRSRQRSALPCWWPG